MNDTPQTLDSFDDISHEQRDRLIEVLETIENDIRKQNSLKFTFLRGALYGLGTVIGASVLVALFGGLIATAINHFSGDQILTETLDLRQ